MVIPSWSFAQEMNDPCPNPSMALDNAPNGTVEIQGDIDRLTLCVERAQLLQRLNDIATAGMKLPSPLTQSQLPILPLPEQMLGTLQNVNVREGWEVLQVFGSKEELFAKLFSPEGGVIRIKVGDKLPDESGKIIEILPMRVKIKNSSGVQTLPWVRDE